jgi:hypothetical protein
VSEIYVLKTKLIFIAFIKNQKCITSITNLILILLILLIKIWTDYKKPHTKDNQN